MQNKIFVVIIGAMSLLMAGCVGTVSGGHTGGVPFVKDTIEGRYPRSVDVVFNAAKQVIIGNGVLSNETIIHSETNDVKTIIGKVNQRSVWVRVEPVDSKITSVSVQTRTAGGASDLDLAHELEKEIALKLVQ